jgi:N-acetylglucosamine-6-phosphate deacetylase
LVTLAPEVIDPRDIQGISNLEKVRIFAGHTDCSWVDDDPFYISGCTHLMNGMPGVIARDSGAFGWLVTNGSKSASLIGDGSHVCAKTLAILKRATLPGQLFLVSDIMPSELVEAGAVSFLRGAKAHHGGALAFEDGKLAGSGLTLRHGIKNLVQSVGVPIIEALRMATSFPAKAGGLGSQSLRVGSSADLVAFDNQFNVMHVFRQGRPVFGSVGRD